MRWDPPRRGVHVFLADLIDGGENERERTVVSADCGVVVIGVDLRWIWVEQRRRRAEEDELVSSNLIRLETKQEQTIFRYVRVPVLLRT